MLVVENITKDFPTRGAPLPVARWISQGAQAGRPSSLRLRIDAEGQVCVAGSVIRLGEGVLRL